MILVEARSCECHSPSQLSEHANNFTVLLSGLAWTYVLAPLGHVVDRCNSVTALLGY